MSLFSSYLEHHNKSSPTTMSSTITLKRLFDHFMLTKFGLYLLYLFTNLAHRLWRLSKTNLRETQPIICYLSCRLGRCRCLLILCFRCCSCRCFVVFVRVRRGWLSSTTPCSPHWANKYHHWIVFEIRRYRLLCQLPVLKADTAVFQSPCDDWTVAPFRNRDRYHGQRRRR
jgi:hypothetical protein